MNNRFLRVWSVVLSVMITGLFSACSDDDPELPANLLTFETSTVGLADDVAEISINLKTDRAISTATTVQIAFTANGVEYGEDFVTEPAASANSVSVTIPANATTASFTVVRTTTKFLIGTESVTFEINNTGTTGLVAGETHAVTLSFSSIVSEGSQLTLQGIAGAEAGSSAANSVFVNFRSNTQTPVLRASWDLGFYSGADFRVILNNTTSAGAKVTTATNLADIVAADTIGLTLAVSQGAPAPEHFAFFDGLDGSLSSTVIPAISATASDNKVIIINRGTGGGTPARPWIKAKITRNTTGGYTIEYGAIQQTSGFTSVDIPKDAAYNFKYLSFNNGGTLVNVEPKKADWDITWSYSLYQTNFGSMVPYNFSDIVSINKHGGIKVAEVLTSTVSYENYAESHISSAVFSSERYAIGTSWRTATSDASPHVLADRFYVVQDALGNVYKLKFISFHPAEGGTRGKPVIDYELVKKAED